MISLISISQGSRAPTLDRLRGHVTVPMFPKEQQPRPHQEFLSRGFRVQPQVWCQRLQATSKVSPHGAACAAPAPPRLSSLKSRSQNHNRSRIVLIPQVFSRNAAAGTARPSRPKPPAKLQELPPLCLLCEFPSPAITKPQIVLSTLCSSNL